MPGLVVVAEADWAFAPRPHLALARFQVCLFQAPAGMPMPWQRVLLKQPGVVPAGGVTRGLMCEFAPAVWHLAHSGAFPRSVFTWLVTLVLLAIQGLSGCGAFVWQLLQETAGPLS